MSATYESDFALVDLASCEVTFLLRGLREGDMFYFN